MKREIRQVVKERAKSEEMVFSHITQSYHRPIIVLAAEERCREDLFDIRETFYIRIVDDRNIIIKCLKRRVEHAGVSNKPEQKNNANKRYVVFGDFVSKVWHYGGEEKIGVSSKNIK